jgi:hypothetical protein
MNRHGEQLQHPGLLQGLRSHDIGRGWSGLMQTLSMVHGVWDMEALIGCPNSRTRYCCEIKVLFDISIFLVSQSST